MEMPIAIAGLLALIGGIALLLIATRRTAARVVRLEESLARTPERLDALAQRMLDSDQRILTHTTDVFGGLNERLGSIEAASRRALELGEQVRDLESLFQAPQLRGGIGEFLLESLLRQTLPADTYELQHAFRDGSRVDAAVRIGEALVPIDAKFPLDSFRRLLDCDGEDGERRRARREFLGAVRGHIDAIADRYIRPDEGTYGFALMYIPAENVYYEAILRDEDGGLFEYALERRVIPVSPTSFYAYLLVVVWGLRGLRIEDRAQEILGVIGRLREDLGQLRAGYRVLGTHLENARSRYDDGLRKLTEIDGRLEAAAGGVETESPGDRGAGSAAY